MTGPTIGATVAWVTPTVQDVTPVRLAPGATIAEAIARSGLVEAYGLDLAALGVAVFGKRRSLDAEVREGDRIELLRPLVADPKAARRARAASRPRQGG